MVASLLGEVERHFMLAHTHIPSKKDVIVATDASGSWGCGAAWSQNWFHCPWNEAWAGEPINTKELVPIVLAVAMWGSLWRVFSCSHSLRQSSSGNGPASKYLQRRNHDAFT